MHGFKFWLNLQAAEKMGRPDYRDIQGDSLSVIAERDSGLLLFGGLPLNEPVAHYGPFVMNTKEEIDQAIRDYQAGTLVQV